MAPDIVGWLCYSVSKAGSVPFEYIRQPFHHGTMPLSFHPRHLHHQLHRLLLLLFLPLRLLSVFVCSTLPPKPNLNSSFKPRNMSSVPPPPPPPPAPVAVKPAAPARAPTPPVVADTSPITGGYLVELYIYGGAPHKDHWAFFIRSHDNSVKGNMIHVEGDKRKGFTLEFRHGHNSDISGRAPSQVIPLQWIDKKYVKDPLYFTFVKETPKTHTAAGEFETIVAKVHAPEPSLNTAEGKKTPKNCQNWICEAGEQLVKDGVFGEHVATFLEKKRQKKTTMVQHTTPATAGHPSTTTNVEEEDHCNRCGV
ncbi:hypothetical protein B0T24DRAFT_632451 [Lasiosphaeria ovina]|uniref:Uncharacterized protein n=1 Tax=Lasiosphaeria ovina TaxID=92902 RepID=A0AAE0K3C5_9PEZI|nr:hypothetical protein B0T24DRAFT_632451 [Lasiosphaeria ovina]